MRFLINSLYFWLWVFWLCSCARDYPPTLAEIRQVLLSPADSLSQAQIFAKFQHYLTQQPDSLDIFIKNNQNLIYKFYTKLLRQASFARLEGADQSGQDYFNLAAKVAIKCRLHFKDPFFPYIYQFYIGLSNQQLHTKLVIDYYNYQGYREKNVNRENSAEVFFLKAVRLGQDIGDLVGESYAQYSLYQIYSAWDRDDERQAAYQRAHELIDNSYHRKYKILLLNSEGQNNLTMGFYEQAAAIFHRACLLSVEISDTRNLSLNLERLGICYRTMGNHQKASQTWQQAEKIALDNSDTFLLTNLMVDQGNLRLEMSRFQEALDYFQKAGAHYLSVNDSINYSVTRVNSGIPYFQLGQYDSALACFDEALSIQERHNAYDNIVMTLLTISNFYNRLSRPEAAQKYFKSAEKYLTGIKSLSVRATLYRIIGESYLKLNKPDQAQAHYLKAKNISTQMGDSVYLAFAHNGIGLSAVEKRDFGLALDNFNQVLNIAQKKGVDRLLFLAYYGLAKVNIRLKENHLALEYFEKAINYIERIRESVEVIDYKMSYLAHQLQVYDDVICFALEHLKAPELAFNYAEKAIARNLIEILQMKSLMPSGLPASKNLPVLSLENKYFSTFSSALVNPKLGYNHIQRNLPPAACLIEFYLTRNYAFVWLIDSLNVSSQFLRVPYDSLRQAVDAFRKDIGADEFKNFKTRVQQEPEATFASNISHSNRLYELLIQPLESRLKDFKTLVIIPHDFLTYLPFAALTQKGTILRPGFLVERFDLITAPSSALFAQTYQRSQKSPPIGPRNRLLSVSAPISDIQYLGKLSGDFKSFFQQPTLIDDQIEESKIRAYLQDDVSVVHFGTHCIIYEDNPMFSHLVLQEQQTWENIAPVKDASQANDGLFTTMEILQQDLSHVNLVTLASCETALGKYYGGEGLVGLTFAFLGSGAQNIISSLWKVDDRFTYETMRSFYGFMVQPQIPSPKCLQLANQLVIRLLRNDPQIKYPFPYYWAAFVCCGYCY